MASSVMSTLVYTCCTSSISSRISISFTVAAASDGASGLLNNYTVSYNTATFTITQASTTTTVDTAQANYGNANVTLSAHVIASPPST